MSGISTDLTDLRRYCLDLGFAVFGVADITGIRDGFLLHDRLKSRYDRAVSLGVRVQGSVLDDIDDRPTPLYLHHYRQLNFFLDRGALLAAQWIADRGFEALPVAASQIVDWTNQMAHVPHKKVALLAGLGWIGRNNLLVNPDLGSRLRLVTILTDMPLESAKPLAFGCGSCLACIAPCPAGAIKEDPAAFDHRGCYAKLDEWRRAHVVSQHICGVCVRACLGPQASG
jgi:epoxyqueuosine reductase